MRSLDLIRNIRYNTSTRNKRKDDTVMKRFLLYVFTIALLLILCACGGQNKENTEGTRSFQGNDEQQESDFSQSAEIEDMRDNDGQGQSEASPIFTNDYGTRTTICAHSGCTNYIASSGDTNCCTEHSNKCFNCGKYIDEDAMYCMDCLSGDTTEPDDSGAYTSNNVPDGGCQYSYFDGSVCGAKTNKYDNLCDKHFEELYDIYDSLLG